MRLAEHGVAYASRLTLLCFLSAQLIPLIPSSTLWNSTDIREAGALSYQSW